VSTVWLGCIVEGEGEVVALRGLIRRVAARVDPNLYVEVPRPVRVKRHRLDKRFGDLERAIELVMGQIQQPGAILALFDADDDDPAIFGAELHARLQAARSDIPTAAVVAVREYEAWFLAAAESLRGQRGLPPDLAPPANPEAIRDAKGWLRRHMPGSRKYTETSDQAALTERFDLDLARSRAPSFDRGYREIERLLRAVMPASPPDEGTSPSPTAS
jgi:hypothetical protein